MATVLENLETAKTNIAARIAEITASPKPSYAVDGKSVSWESYLATLVNQLEALDRAIIDEGGPYEATTQALT
jgi:hypothetical protein